jgi:hypothetical protein
LARALVIALACLAIDALSVPQAKGQQKGTTERSGPTVTLPSGCIVTITDGQDATRATISIGDPRNASLAASGTLERDKDVAPHGRLLDFEVVGEVGNKSLIITDSYPSRPGGLSYCQAGEERLLHVLVVVERQIRETLRLKLASCRENVELASDGLRWSPDSATLSIHWLFAPERALQQETRVYKISSIGGAKLVAEH